MKLTNVETNLLGIFTDEVALDNLEKIKLVHGWRLITTEATKLVAMYCVAFLAGCFFETFLVHFSFFFFRQVAYGIHSKNYLTCLVISCITFPFSAFLINNGEVAPLSIWVIYSISALLLMLLAPIGSSINNIRGPLHARYLRRKMYSRLCILGVTLLFIPSTITKFLVVGLLIETIAVMVAFIKKED
ncbi:accessory gene regulator B family protein [Sporosarcina sp. FSL K6-3457]|uniref:accessory gene regulator B family protein n=1 Tax=Sporosarcina sp. FSL K6-3457 TaxID=2978204 RepID=UPI0030FC8ABB